jgi:hypothetical protein
MYQIDLAQATDIANERIREAARWRLAPRPAAARPAPTS